MNEAGVGDVLRPCFTLPLRHAIRHECKVTVGYQYVAGNISERISWPFGMGYFDQTEVLMAWCELRVAFRHFRLDRIHQLTILEQRYAQGRRMLMKACSESENIV